MTRFEVDGTEALEALAAWFKKHSPDTDVEVWLTPDVDVIREVDAGGVVFVNAVWVAEHLEAQRDVEAERLLHRSIERGML